MSDVTFDEDSSSLPPIRTVPAATVAARQAGSGMASWLMRKGWAKTPLQANAILIGVVVLCFAITGWMLSGTGNTYQITPEMLRMNEWMKLGGIGVPPETFMPEIR